MHARIINGSIAEWPIHNLREHLRNVSLPVDITNNDLLPDGYVWVLQQPAPDFDPRTQKLVAFGPELRDGQWINGYTTEALTEQELADFARTEQVRVRAKRDMLLRDCDWTQVADAPVDKAAWAAYRQALRDITKQADFPSTVTWPDQP